MKIFNQKIMFGITHNIPGTLNHIIYQGMNATDKILYNVHSKLKKFVVETYGASLTKEKFNQDLKSL